jgi:hypothetical protein
MVGKALSREHGRGWGLPAALVLFLGGLMAHSSARAEADLFQKAVNYVFTGSIDPKDQPDIVDRKSCIIVMRDPKYDRYIKYYLRRFKMNDALFDKNYRGSRVSYELNVKGDDVILEYLNLDKTTVLQGYRSAEIALPGDIDQTRKALNIIYSDYCKPEQQSSPF